MAKDSIKESTALITGTTSEIGRASAYALAREGVDIAGAGIDYDEILKVMAMLENEFKIDTLAMNTDVQKEDEVENMIKQVTSEFGQLDVLICTVGQIASEPNSEDLTTEDRVSMMETNINQLSFPTYAALPYIRETKGNIVLIGSFASQYPRPSHPIYAATRWWMRGFVKNLQASIGDNGVGLTVINPPKPRSKSDSDDTAFKDEIETEEKTRPEKIAEAVVFAARHDHSVIKEINVFSRNEYTKF